MKLPSIRVVCVVVTALSVTTASSIQAVPAKGMKRPTSFFTENVGQFNKLVKFRGTMGKSAIWLESKGVTYDFSRRVKADIEESSIDAQMTLSLPGVDGNYKRERLIVQSRFLGANPDPKFHGINEISGTSNYFLGNDPTKWHSDVANFSEVLFQNIYSGIDVKYYYVDGRIEYDFIVAPGIDPAVIKMEWTGANSVSIDDQGRLVIQTAWGEIIENPPVIFQSDGYTRVDVSGQFVLLAENVVGFEITGEYHPSLALIIDPSVYYASYLGGSGDDEGWDVVVDDCGFAYMTGVTASTNFATTTGAYQVTDSGSGDVFIAKFNTKEFGNNSLVYSTYIGGTDLDETRDLEIDGDGAAYITGNTKSTDFPLASPEDSSLGGMQDAFVTKLNAAGNDLVYSTYLGGSGFDYGYGITVNSSGEAFVTGGAADGFPTSGAAADVTFNGGIYDVFVTKFNAAGSAHIYSTYVGGSSHEYGYSIAVDGNDKAYVAVAVALVGGVFPFVNGFDSTHGGGVWDGAMFVLSDDGDGDDLLYSTYIAGNKIDYPYKIALDADDIAYVTGYTNSSDFDDNGYIKNGFDSTLDGTKKDAFVFKIDATATGASSLIWSTLIGGIGNEIGWGIATMSDGTVWVTGSTDSTGFPTQDPITSSHQGGLDAFIIRIDPDETASSTDQIIFSTYFGGANSDEGYGIHIVDSNGIYVAIETSSDGLGTSTGYQESLHTDEDAFLLRLADFSYVSCVRGDANKDGVIDRADVDYIIAYLFYGGPLVCPESADANCSGGISVADASKIGAYLSTCTGICTNSCACSVAVGDLESCICE